MRDAVAVATTQHAQLVGARGDVRQEIGDFGAGLSPRPKLPQRREQLVFRDGPAGLERAKRFRNRLAREPDQIGLRIEQVHMARTTRHEEEDHALRFGSEMRQFRRKGIGEARRRRGEQSFAAEQRGQRHHSKATTGMTQKRTARRGARRKSSGAAARFSRHRQMR